MKRTALLRRTPLRARNRKRSAAKYARNFGERSDAVRAMPCLVSHCIASGDNPCDGPVQAAHARARGMGGAKGDRRSLVPLCSLHHRESGEHRTSQRSAFEKRVGIDLVAESEWLAVELDRQGLP